MRLDYTLYILATILLIMTVVPFVAPTGMQMTETSIWVISTVGLGLLSIGLGYSQRPKTEAQACQPMKTAPKETIETEAQTAMSKEVSEEKKTKAPMDKLMMKEAPTTKPSATMELTQVKGIGTKRAAQLKALGINNVDELAKASAKTVAKKMKISSKIVVKWISSAKEISK